MNIHEYQAKEILTKYGVETPKGGIAYSPENAKDMATELGGDMWVVRAQIHSGARGKAGGIILCDTPLAVAQATDKLLGKNLVKFLQEKNYNNLYKISKENCDLRDYNQLCNLIIRIEINNYYLKCYNLNNSIFNIIIDIIQNKIICIN